MYEKYLYSVVGICNCVNLKPKHILILKTNMHTSIHTSLDTQTPNQQLNTFKHL